MKDVLYEEEVAVLLKCKPETAQEQARSGNLPATKFGRSWIFPRLALLQFLNELALENLSKTRKTPNAVAVAPGPKGSRRRKLPELTVIRA